MIVQIRDRDALESIPLVSLRAYLNSRGWKDVGIWGERPITIFAMEHAGRTWEILVPHLDTIGGYAENMAESVAVLAEVENRSQLDVFADLANIDADSDRKDTTAPDTYEDRTEYLFDPGGRYSLAEAARYVKAASYCPRAPRTIAVWFRRWTADSELSQSDGGKFPVIFSDLIAMRLVAPLLVSGVKWQGMRTVVRWLGQYAGTAYPLVSRDIWSNDDWVDDVCKLAYPAPLVRGVSKITEPDLAELLSEHILPEHGLTFDEKSGRATSWEVQPGIALNPLIQFGAPCIKGTRIPTAALAGMVAAGDSPESTARDYQISTNDVEAACDWERRVYSRRAVITDNLERQL